MHIPKVSICLPNLNTRPYLPERFETIVSQTFHDWELIVCDNHSDDGAWEFFQEQALRDTRIRLSQAPREGMYANWNNCIRQARGEYVYIATSDDTMTPDCLEKLVAALEHNPDCGLAHCCLDFIDEGGTKITSGHCWENWPSTRYVGELNNEYHVRPRGHDAVVALAMKTAYYSITQILIRRSLFDEVGMFENKWGSFGDLEWQMRAALLTSTIHVPEHLATWRVHPKQASQLERYYAARRDGLFVQMADTVINFSRQLMVPVPQGLPRRLRRFFLFEQIYSIWDNLPGRLARIRYLIVHMITAPSATVMFLRNYPHYRHWKPRPLEQEVGRELVKLGIAKPQRTAPYRKAL